MEALCFLPWGGGVWGGGEVRHLVKTRDELLLRLAWTRVSKGYNQLQRLGADAPLLSPHQDEWKMITASLGHCPPPPATLFNPLCSNMGVYWLARVLSTPLLGNQLAHVLL